MWAPLLLAFCGAAAYANSLHAPFIFDDRYHIVENTLIRRLWPPWPYLLHTSRPVVYLSVALNYAIGGLDPVGYHVFNIAVHILAALVLYGILRRTFWSPALRERFGARSAPLAGLVALLWMLHPLQTESVTYIIQRGESLMGLFYLLVLYCVIRASNSPASPGWYAAAVASMLAGLGCKGVILTAPVVILLYDRAFLAPSWREAWRRRWGLYAGFGAACLLYPVLLAQAPAEWQDSAGFSFTGATPFAYALTQSAVLVRYLRLALWPAGLCLDYGWPVARAREVLPQLLFIGLLLGLTVWAWRRARSLAFLGVWFFLILVPTSSFLPIADLAVEHRMYLSLAAVIALMVAGLSGPILRAASPRIAVLACAFVALALAGLTARRNLDYASELGMWRDTVAERPANPRAQYDLGDALEHQGMPEEAAVHYRIAVDERPDYVDALNNLGHILLVSGKVSDAVGPLQRALQLKPDLAQAHLNLGYALAQQGKTAEAVAHMQEALRLKPSADAHNNLAILLATSGKTEDAISHWKQALALDPGSVDAHINLAYALSQSGGTREAISHYQRVLELKPDYAPGLNNYARLLATASPKDGGDAKRAIDLATRACALTGNRDAGYLETLAIADAAANRFPDAIQAALRARELARSANQRDLAPRIEALLNLYRADRTH
ncbi:MAG TPA: tetratricopeptide repeat protein [Bryobacteraceae bacterium]|nr:tetratricopeptide repeat protein [Bryobacteraceae bacterium]